MVARIVEQRSPLRSLTYFMLRHLLRRQQLTATIEPLGLRVRAYAKDVMGRHLYKRGAHEALLGNYVLQHLPLREDAKNMGRHSLVPMAGLQPIEVRVMALDDSLQEQRIDPAAIDFVKIDVEGYELPALRGARRLLAARPTILAEFAPKYIRRADADPAAMLQFLLDAGFKPYECTAAGRRPYDLTGIAAGDVRHDILWAKS